MDKYGVKIWKYGVQKQNRKKIIQADSTAKMVTQPQQKYQVNKLLGGDWIREQTTN